MKLHFYDYRYAGAVLDHPDFAASKDDLLQVLRNTEPPLLRPEKTKKRLRRGKVDPETERYFFLPVDQSDLNVQLEDALRPLGWDIRPYIINRDKPGPASKLAADFKKDRLQVEVQFGNMARWYTDVFKFQLSYSLDDIDVAILVVPTQGFSNLIDENVASYERVLRELPWAKMSLTLPIMVIGVEPDDYAPARARYYEAAELVTSRAGARPTYIVPFEYRIREVPGDLAEPEQNLFSGSGASGQPPFHRRRGQ